MDVGKQVGGRLLVAVGALVLAAAGGDDKAAPTQLPDLVKARAALAESEFDVALAKAEDGLEVDSENLDLLEVASHAAENLNDLDLALWYARLGLDLARDDSVAIEPARRAEFTKKLDERVKDLDLVSTKDDVHSRFESFSKEIFNLARSCEGKGYFVNAVDLYGMCKDTPLEAKAESQLDKIFDNSKARTQLAETGIELPAESISKSRARKIAQFDSKHDSWATAATKDTSNYKIKTSGGLQILEDLCEAMEIMNRFYRDVFDPAKKSTKCEIRLYQNRAEFDQGEGGAYGGQGPPREVRGFFVPNAYYVATYLDDDDVWSTLFHEASHQFTREVTDGLIPGWLNEGTASYFEGARLLPNGAVLTNEIPESRLRGAHEAITLGEPALGTVINYFQSGSYPGPYYPVGWSLVYFIHNYEDDKCERVYVPPYKNYLKSYRKPAKPSPMERFGELFVTKAKQPGVETFEQFEERWKSWVLDLHKLYFGPPEMADQWIAKARKQLSFKKTAAALESYRHALRKRPNDIVALMEQADLLASEKGKKDNALHNYRQVINLARQMDPQQDIPGLSMKPERCLSDTLKRLQALDPQVADTVRLAYFEFGKIAAQSARSYHEGGFPRMALGMLDNALQLLGGDFQLRELRERIQEESPVDVRRWKRLSIDASLSDWSSSTGWSMIPTGLSRQTDHLDYIYYAQTPPESFRLEVTVHPGDVGDGMAGLVFGQTRKGQEGFAVNGGQLAIVSKMSADGIATLPANSRETATLAVDVTPTLVTFYVGDRPVGKKSYEPGKLRPRLGLFVQAANARFERIRVKY